jgi:hypothetical protein
MEMESWTRRLSQSNIAAGSPKDQTATLRLAISTVIETGYG